MAVLDPLKVVITNYPEGKTETLHGKSNPEDENSGTREIPFGREIFIERSDFMEDAPKKFFRLTVGGEVRLKYAYIIRCNEVVKNAEGEIVELHCTYDEDSKSGSGTEASQRKVKGTLHWVPAHENVSAELRLYDRLFNVEDPLDVPEGHDFLEHINPDSLNYATAIIEPAIAGVQAGYRCQFERTGYFCVDKDSTAERLIFNRTVSLKDNSKL